MLGIGGGVFKVPAMNLLSKMPLKISIATSNYMIGLTAAGGSIPYLTHGKVTLFWQSIWSLELSLDQNMQHQSFKRLQIKSYA